MHEKFFVSSKFYDIHISKYTFYTLEYNATRWFRISVHEYYFNRAYISQQWTSCNLIFEQGFDYQTEKPYEIMEFTR